MERSQSSLTDPELNPHLSERHLAYLAERAVSPETAAAAGLASLSRHQIEELLERDRPPKGGGLGVPYKGSGETTWRVRLDEAPRSRDRWRTARGPVRPYLPPTVDREVWHDTGRQVLVVEGPVKALATTQAGWPSIGLGGVDTGHDKEAWSESKTARLHPELLKRVAWKGREVVILFDANRATNPRVALGEARLAAALTAAGARPLLAALPPYEGDDRVGPDDLIAREGADALKKLLAELVVAEPLERIRALLAELGRRQGISRAFGLLDELPFQAALYLRGPSLDAQIAHEAKPGISRRDCAERRARFGGLLYTKMAAEEGELPPDKHVGEMNSRHAVVTLGGQARILWEVEDPELGRTCLEFIRERDLELMYKHQRVWQGKKDLSLAAYWLKHPQRRTYTRVVFSPGREVLETDYNLWRGFELAPAPGDWSLLQAHVRDNLASGNEEHYRYIIGWSAHLIQHLAGPRCPTSLVFRGKEGTGKSFYIKQLGRLLGRHFVHVFQSRHLTGHFNSHLADCLLLFGDEAFWAGDKAGDGALKGLITEETIQIERKGQDVIPMENRVRLALASNAEWVVPAGLEARRFAIFDVAEHQLQNELYFRRIAEQMDRGGRAAMLHDLLNFDLSAFDSSPPKTQALLEQKQHSFTPIQRWWHGRLMAGELTPGREWKEPHPCAEIHRLYLVEAKDAGDRRRAVETELGTQLRKLTPHLIHKKDTVVVSREREWDPDEKRMVTAERKERVWCYTFPELSDCRHFFEETLQGSWPWPDEGEDAET